MRILVISIAAHAIALPILARFGAFDKIKKEFAPARVVLIDAKEAPDKEKPEPKKKAAPKTRTQAKGPKTANKPGKLLPANPNKPAVVASNSGTGNGDGPAIEQGTGEAGSVPNPGGGTPAVKPPTVPTTPEVKVPVVTPPTTPTVTPPPPIVKAVEPVAKPKPFVEAEATFQPQPEIPDDLRGEALSKTFIAEMKIGLDGTPKEIRITSSTGVKELDDLALATLKRWRFKVATLGSDPVESPVRVSIEFNVE